MKELTPEQIENNWHDLIDLVNTTFEGERLDKLIEMYVWTTPKGKKVENPVRKEGLVRHKEMVRVEF